MCFAIKATTESYLTRHSYYCHIYISLYCTQSSDLDLYEFLLSHAFALKDFKKIKLHINSRAIYKCVVDAHMMQVAQLVNLCIFLF